MTKKVCRLGLVATLAFCEVASGRTLAEYEAERALLPEGAGRDLVAANCSACHSLQLVVQNRLDRKGWEATLRWMVERQGMWELHPLVREPILVYLSTHLTASGPGASDRPVNPLPEHVR